MELTSSAACLPWWDTACRCLSEGACRSDTSEEVVPLLHPLRRICKTDGLPSLKSSVVWAFPAMRMLFTARSRRQSS
eukprot:scaffold2131_cov384-Prasinococcus_capsulatus_cf.AAC.14